MPSLLQILQEGNLRFTENKARKHDYRQEAESIKDKQKPFAAILTCIDSRVEPNLIFDQGIGQLVVSRTAGNIVNDDILAGLEFACTTLGAEMILVLGHTQCGTIEACAKDDFRGHLSQLLPKFKEILADPIDAPLFLDSAKNQARRALQQIREQSSIIAQLIKENKISTHAAIYDVQTGKVTFL